MFKLIPHCAKGSWVVSQSVGTTPVILGRKLATTYHQCDRSARTGLQILQPADADPCSGLQRIFCRLAGRGTLLVPLICYNLQHMWFEIPHSFPGLMTPSMQQRMPPGQYIHCD